MTAITNLIARVCYSNTPNQPILLLGHGWNGDATSFGDTTLKRLAAYGLFVVSVGLRGRNSATGANDCSAREIYDFYDALTTVRSRFARWVSPTKAAFFGLSAGGGNAFAIASKFPDTFNVITEYFGMSDYGRDATDGWYQNGAEGYPAAVATAIGDTPTNVPDKYYARDATVAITNFSGGFLYLYHDKQDTVVPWVHSNRIKTVLDNASMTNYAASFTDVGDPNRWTHGYDVVIPEATWCPKIIEQDVWTIPESGTITVIGYIVTKRFTIWLNSGLDATATVVYDTVAGTYTVTPLTSNSVVAVTITQGALSASGNTDGETLFTVT